MVGTTSNTVPLAVFGPGSLYVTRNDIANQTPVNIGYAQEFSYDEAGETKELYGQNQYPLVIARGTLKATGKMKAATVSGIALNAVFNGQSFLAGQLIMAQGEAQTITAGAATPSHGGTGTFDTDLGVIYALTSLPLMKVTAAPTVGQYSVNAVTGAYAFNTAENTVGVLLTYAYLSASGGQKIIVSNTPIGTTPTFQIDYSSSLYGQPYYVRMFAAVSTKLTRAHKLVDFMMPEIDFGFFANQGQQVYEISYPQIS
jgi:hypothetical protein